ncbi:hypothetical protein IWW55_001293 [Coemansia sp. RSA 2706]|nr:hypothetical protein IWW55_001293 [Coemansia sp. RSA 2706]KAJ2319337.1 hypothetical protein IWW52_002032 [Coemansia sp. RSA 2704]KAJ2323203.1 hypothetical protein IWW51_003873 [Coemansia sp. RSA 2702]
MSTAIATPSSVELQSTESHLLYTAACSVKALLRTSDATTGLLTSNLHSNFAHLAPARPSLPSIETFVCSVATTLSATPVVVVTSLIYVERLSARLPQSARGKADTPYRIFLAALLLADKYWSDQAVKVKMLVAATGGLFRHREILAMERALLRILRFDLFVSADQIRDFASKLGIDINATTSL